jgi:hypothetical protein
LWPLRDDRRVVHRVTRIQQAVVRRKFVFVTKLAFRRLAAAIAGAAVLTGCTPAAQPVASADAEFQALVARELSFAEAGGASPEQLRILSESATEGELT